MAGEIELQDVNVKDLPPLAQDLVTLIGFDPTIRLVDARPGIPMFVPKMLPLDHWLIETLGKPAAEALVKHYGGETITPPNCKFALVKIRHRHILKSREDGLSQTETALIHGVTPRWVREVESREPVEERNGRLF
jgi:hypothetical protein